MNIIIINYDLNQRTLAKRKAQILNNGQIFISKGNVSLCVPGKSKYTLSHARHPTQIDA